MTQTQLQQLVEQISLQFFNRAFKNRVKINYRMTTTGGRYHLQDHHLEINAHFLTPQYYDALVGIIKHELTHYHLHLAHRGYRHRDADFKKVLKLVGGSRYTPDIGLRRKQKAKYLYQCRSCKRQFARVRRLDLARYACGYCGGRLQVIQKEN